MNSSLGLGELETVYSNDRFMGFIEWCRVGFVVTTIWEENERENKLEIVILDVNIYIYIFIYWGGR